MQNSVLHITQITENAEKEKLKLAQYLVYKAPLCLLFHNLHFCKILRTETYFFSILQRKEPELRKFKLIFKSMVLPLARLP